MSRLHRGLCLLGLGALLAVPACQPAAKSGSGASLPFAWPPQPGKPYPSLVLKDHQGQEVRLADYEGRVLLIEPIGMNCPACNAFAGAGDGRIQGFRGTQPQQGLRSLAHYLPQYTGGLDISNPKVVHVHLLLYGPTMQAPTQEEAQDWARHFGVDQKPNHLVLVGDPRMMGQASYNMIPGFQLVDQNFILRSDSTGHHPRHNLYTELLPKLGGLVRGN